MKKRSGLETERFFYECICFGGNYLRWYLSWILTVDDFVQS